MRGIELLVAGLAMDAERDVRGWTAMVLLVVMLLLGVFVLTLVALSLRRRLRPRTPVHEVESEDGPDPWEESGRRMGKENGA